MTVNYPPFLEIKEWCKKCSWYFIGLEQTCQTATCQIMNLSNKPSLTWPNQPPSLNSLKWRVWIQRVLIFPLGKIVKPFYGHVRHRSALIMSALKSNMNRKVTWSKAVKYSKLKSKIPCCFAYRVFRLPSFCLRRFAYDGSPTMIRLRRLYHLPNLTKPNQPPNLTLRGYLPVAT